jgi:FkbM family methyltransferase
VSPEQSLPADFQIDHSLLLSQGRQDVLLWNMLFFNDSQYQSGFFVEFGARNGKSESNSYFYENQLGWRGLLLEAIPGEQLDIASNRPGAAVVDGGICEEDKHVEFAIASIGGWSGRADSYDVDRKRTTPMTPINVACFSLTTLLEEFGIHHVSYLSVDTEGSELQALRGFPWGKVTTDVVGVEILTGTPERLAKQTELYAFMESVGMRILIEHQFAGDTKDTFFVPVDHFTRRSNSYHRFAATKKTCIKMMRCLGTA